MAVAIENCEEKESHCGGMACFSVEDVTRPIASIMEWCSLSKAGYKLIVWNNMGNHIPVTVCGTWYRYRECSLK